MNEISFGGATLKTGAFQCLSRSLLPLELVFSHHKQAILFVITWFIPEYVEFFWTLPAQTMIKLCQIANFNGKIHTFSRPIPLTLSKTRTYSYFIFTDLKALYPTQMQMPPPISIDKTFNSLIFFRLSVSFHTHTHHLIHYSKYSISCRLQFVHFWCKPLFCRVFPFLCRFTVWRCFGNFS